MSSLEELRQERIAKREKLIAAGMQVYPATTGRTHEHKEILATVDEFISAATTVTVAGRVMALRLHGGSAFVDLFDGTSKLQLFIAKDTLCEEVFSLFTDTVDIGDFIAATGTMFVTKRETYALAVSDWKMLTKSLVAIPSEHFGIKDEDERFRKRYLDILLNQELRELFEKKAKFWDVTRDFLKRRGFQEVETPTLEVTTGGAEARPFKTYHNDFDIDVYLRISIGELWQKHLMAAGIPKTFEIGRAYRNEGTSPEHLQEFTNMEFYWAYADYRDGMKLVRELYIEIAEKVFGTTKFETRGHTFDLADEWKEIDYVEEIQTRTGINILTASEEDMKAKLTDLGVKYEGDNRERLSDTLWKYCRKQISGPAFLVNHPILVAPLAKARLDGQTVEMFQPIIAGSEVGRGYSELNDPEDQRRRFEVQQALLEAGDEEAMMPDWEFVEMLEHGMPPTCGFGFGERLFAFLAGKPLRETQYFPLMRPKDAPKKLEVDVAVAIYNQGAGMVDWQVQNTIAHLAAELGVRGGKKLLKFNDVVTKDNLKIPMNIQHAIVIKKAADSNSLFETFRVAREAGLHVATFTREMLETTNDNKIKEITSSKIQDEIELLGVLVFGPKSKVDALTANYQL